MPLFSIIIPVYNVADWLPECINSVLSSPYKNYEILLVDDGSTDGKSGEICDAYQKDFPNLIKVFHQENGGLGAARNTGINNATGEYLFFLDSDDYIEQDTFDGLSQAIDKYHSDMILFGSNVIENGKKTGTVEENIPINTIFSVFDYPKLLLTVPSAWGKLCKKSLFIENNIEFPPRVLYEDLRTTRKLFLYAKSVIRIENTYYNYRIRENSIMTTKALDRNLEIIDALEDITFYFKSKNLDSQFKDELEFLTLYHVFLVASVRIIKIDSQSKILDALYDYTGKKYPAFKSNRYIKEMPKRKQLLLTLLYNKKRNLVATIFKIKELLKV